MIWRWFWREWRSPSLLIVWIALTLAVACVLALGNISDRMERGLNQQSRDLLAGDRVLRGSYPADEQWLAVAKQNGLSVSRQISFMTMSYANNVPLLTSVKASDSLYPLYGKLETAPANLQVQPGQVLVSARLMALLNVKPGQSIDVGDTTLLIQGELLQEPDATFNPFQTSPRILMSLNDVEKTGAIQPGSRLTYRYMFAGSAQAIDNFSQYIEPKLRADQRWTSVENSGSAVAQSLTRAKSFLLLSASLTLLLAGAAITVAMNHYCRSRYDLIAILKTLGASRPALRRLIMGQWLSVLLLALLTGGLIGLGFEALLLQLLQPVLPEKLPSASALPWIWSIALLVCISLLIGARPYKQLLSTQPIRVLRHDTLSTVWPLRWYIPIILLLISVVMLSLVGLNLLWWSLLFGVGVLAVLLGIVAWVGLFILRRLSVRQLTLRLAINRLLRQPWSTLSQLSSFALSFMLLTLLLMLRGDLLSRWQQQLPPDSPNYFAMNISDRQLDPVKQYLSEQKIPSGKFYPVIRVRLTNIDDQLASERIKEASPGYEAINRELNLTWLDQTTLENPLSAGRWPPQMGEVSIEKGVAERLGVGIGTKLTFTGDTVEFSAVISSIRDVNWQNLRPNFYFIFPKGGLDGQPQNWLTSFNYQGDGQALTEFSRQFPTVSLLDVGNIVKQITQILQQVSRALEVMVGLVLSCGFLLLLAQIQVGMQQRQQEIRVYRILGASKRLLRQTLWCEFALLGFAAGIAAALGAEVALGLLQVKVFEFPWQINYSMWIILPIISTLLLSLCGGWLGGRLLPKGR